MDAPREQEQSIKERKKLLFDHEESPAQAALAAEWKPFSFYLQKTPAQPMSGLVKASLWAAAVVVLLLLFGAAWKSSQPKVKTSFQIESSRAIRLVTA